MRKQISILGSTGSVGTQTLEVVRRYPDQFQAVGLAAGGNIDKLLEQIAVHRPRVVSVATEDAAARLRERLPQDSAAEVLVGEDGAIAVATSAPFTVSAMVGAAGLAPTLVAVQAGNTVALANKEVLVMAGALVTSEARKSGATLLPVDSEHAALHQLISHRENSDIQRLILTGSGGPFLNARPSELADVSQAQATNHPRWNMGAKISVDSATLLNKGFELIEARWLFDVGPDKLDAVIHPEAIVHALVEFCDGSMTAHMGVPDMASPIGYTLAYPHTLENLIAPLDLTKIGSLHFSEPPAHFPAFQLARETLRASDAGACALAAADEVAIDGFMSGRIRFPDIPRALEATVTALSGPAPGSLAAVQALDASARNFASEWIRKNSL